MFVHHAWYTDIVDNCVNTTDLRAVKFEVRCGSLTLMHIHELASYQLFLGITSSKSGSKKTFTFQNLELHKMLA